MFARVYVRAGVRWGGERDHSEQKDKGHFLATGMTRHTVAV